MLATPVETIDLIDMGKRAREASYTLAGVSTAQKNAAILAINAQLGFAQHRDVRTFQITQGAIESTLARSPKIGSNESCA